MHVHRTHAHARAQMYLRACTHRGLGALNKSFRRTFCAARTRRTLRAYARYAAYRARTVCISRSYARRTHGTWCSTVVIVGSIIVIVVVSSCRRVRRRVCHRRRHRAVIVIARVRCSGASFAVSAGSTGCCARVFCASAAPAGLLSTAGTAGRWPAGSAGLVTCTGPADPAIAMALLLALLTLLFSRTLFVRWPAVC
jgi:hypothetical protein